VIIVHEAIWALVVALLAYGLGRCGTEPDLQARMASEQWRWVRVLLKWFTLLPVGWFVVVQLWIHNVLPQPSFTGHVIVGGSRFGWPLIAAILAYFFGCYSTAPHPRMTREPWRWLGTCLKWVALPAVVYALMSTLLANGLLPSPYRDQLWIIVMAASMTPLWAYFIWFIVAWFKLRGRSED